MTSLKLLSLLMDDMLPAEAFERDSKRPILSMDEITKIPNGADQKGKKEAQHETLARYGPQRKWFSHMISSQEDREVFTGVIYIWGGRHCANPGIR